MTDSTVQLFDFLVLSESEAKILVSSAPLLEKCGAAVSKKVASPSGLQHIIHCEHDNKKDAKLDGIDGSVQLTSFENISSTDAGGYEAPEVTPD